MNATRMVVASAAASLVALAAPGAFAKTSAPARAYLKPVVPFIEDDYARALAEAKARHVPLFVEAWAPW